jgi:hypothetical protein
VVHAPGGSLACPSTATCASARACSTRASTRHGERDHPAAGAPPQVDAGIFFSDIVVPLKLVGVDVEIQPGRGPVFGRAYADAAGVAELTAVDPARLDEASAPSPRRSQRTVAELNATDNGSGTATPLIGFAGAPFTLAAYLAEGGPSKDHLAARTLMHADPGAWRALMEWTAELTGRFLRTQVLPGHPRRSSSTPGRARSRSPTTRRTWRPPRRRRSRTCTTSSTRRRMPRARP